LPADRLRAMRDSPATSPLRLASLLVPPLALMAVIFYLSAQPGAEEYAAWEVAIRKLGHAGGYALLAFAWWRAFRGLLPSLRPALAVAAAVTVSLAYAVSDELHQTAVTGRHGSPLDVLIDAAGITAVALVALRLSRPRRAGAPGRGAPTEVG
jgi:VanZ family protein